MAKARKAARKSARKPVAKRRTKKAKLKGRRVSKRSVAKKKKKGIIAGNVQAVAESVSLRSRLGGRNTFED